MYVLRVLCLQADFPKASEDRGFGIHAHGVPDQEFRRIGGRRLVCSGIYESQWQVHLFPNNLSQHVEASK